jgi:two-component system phosphate regulon sensor histidine kinase PhoR
MANSPGKSVLRKWTSRLERARPALAGAAIVLAALWLAGLLAGVPALLAFAAIVAFAAVMAPSAVEPIDAGVPGEPAPARTGEVLVEAVLAGLPDPALVLARGGEIVALNSRASALFPALRRGEPVSLALRMPEILDAIRRARATGTMQRAEFVERVPFEHWYEAAATPISMPELAAGPDLLLLVFHDRTQLRRVEEMRVDFVANASHELRTPLAALSGFIDTLQGAAREDPHTRERFLSIMQAQATRMARLIDDLLSLSRIELSEHLRPDRLVDLIAILRQVADTLQTLARDRDVEVDISAPPGPLLVLGDRDELIRVFENLVENALKYAASGKRVEIKLSLAEAPDGRKGVHVAVRDQGPGIAPEHLPRLTERFYRVDVADSRAQGGTGLGLALVKHILNRHGGRLKIDSVPGQGATFTAQLPLPPASGNQR